MFSASQIETNFKFFLTFIGLKAFFVLLVILFGPIHLAPDEAQYWLWSRFLDWGYYSKPPGIAWQIHATTALLGHSELGIRIGALLIGTILPCILYFTAKKIGLSARAAFWAGMMLAFSPLGFFFTFAATTDGGLTLFFTLAIMTLIVGMQKPAGPSYPLIGFWIFLGALYKWLAFVFWPLLFILLLFYSTLRKKTIFLGILISLLALLPSVYWNMSHDWATFKHVGKTLVRTGDAHGAVGNPGDFLAAQIGLISPVFFGMLIFGLIWVFKRYRTISLSLMICSIVTAIVGLYWGASFFKKMQPNWAFYLYPAGFIVAAFWACEQWKAGKTWLRIGLIISLVMLIFALSIPSLQEHEKMSLSYRRNPFRQNVGWQRVRPILEQAGYNPHTDFLLGDKYQTASILSFYGPGQKRAYFFNLNFQRKNQFSYWPSAAPQEIGKTGYFVVLENKKKEASQWYEEHYLKLLAPYFQSVTFVNAYPLFEANGVGVKTAFIFRGEGYKGQMPPNPEEY